MQKNNEIVPKMFFWILATIAFIPVSIFFYKFNFPKSWEDMTSAYSERFVQ